VCRWLAYSGSPVLIKELLLEPQHSLIDQSLHSAHIRSPLVFAHIPASSGSPVQLTNCHRSATAAGSGCTTA
jgi:predicted glutamine amidotransferase